MLEIGQKLFAKMHKRKKHANHNHEIHDLARGLGQWLPEGIQSLIAGTYTPRHLKRLYFTDETVDQLHPTDRVLQHILLQQLKPTFSRVISQNCYHIFGPNGVKLATQRIRQILENKKPQFFIRVDVKSYYRSVLHFKLIEDIKKYYDDPKVIKMLEEIIRNPIDTPKGCKNPIQGLALRGPLSQFFSGLFLKKLDDAFDFNTVDYLRYNDDILILCQTKRQFNRCRRKLMEILKERHLTLSRKKSKMGSLHSGFHFLGVNYLGTQPQDINRVAPSNDGQFNSVENSLTFRGGGRTRTEHQENGSLCIVPHCRTLRNARIQVQAMICAGFSAHSIRTYLHQWATWWQNTASFWTVEELLNLFIKECWTLPLAAIAAGLLKANKSSKKPTSLSTSPLRTERDSFPSLRSSLCKVNSG